MEEKSNLMIKISKLSEEIDALSVKKARIEQAIQDSPIECKREQASVMANAQRAMQAMIESKRERIVRAVADTATNVESIIDKCTLLEETGPVGKHNISELESHLGEVYPPDMIQSYQCLNPIQYSDDSEVGDDYRHAEVGVLNLRRGNFAGTVFNGLSALLDKAADYPQLGSKVAGFLALFFLATLILSPFMFLTAFVGIGTLSAIQGHHVQTLLRKIYSVKQYLSDDYDEEDFLNKKEEIMGFTRVFLEEAQDNALDVLQGMSFEMDPEVIPKLIEKYNKEMVSLQQELTEVDQQLGLKSQNLEELINDLDRLTEQEKKKSEGARKHYLGTIDWKKEWMQRVFIELTSEGKAKMMEFNQGNAIHYSKDADKLKQLSRLIVYQSLIHMHPDFASTLVLDYKYNGGDLTQFAVIPDRSIKLCYSEDDRNAEMENITNKIRSRTAKILSTCESIGEYNKLMESYGTTGEYYVVVHIFGIHSLSDQLLSNIRNGPRVGFFFKFYWTYKELEEFKDELPLSDVSSFLEITDNPMPRTANALRRIVNSGA